MNFHDYKILETRLNDTDIYTLIADCDTILAENATEFMRLLRSALSLSAHVLEKDKSALAHQLAGRLYHHVDKNADIKAFVDGITPPKNSLYPIYNGYDPLLPAGGMLVRMMKHESYVKGIQEMGDGRILSWGFDSTLRLWGEDGNLLKILSKNVDQINGARLLKDGRILSRSSNGTLQLWSNDGEPLKILMQNGDMCIDTLELTNGHILSWHHDSNALIMWDKNGEKLALLTGHTETIEGVIELIDNTILSWAQDHTFRIWDREGHLLKIINGEDVTINEIEALIEDRIASQNARRIWLWDKCGELLKIIKSKREYHKLRLSSRRVLLWAWSQSNNDDKNILYLYDANGNLLNTLVTPKTAIRGVLELADDRILTWSEDNILRFWDRDGNFITTVINTRPYIVGLFGVFQLSNGHLLTYAGNGTLYLLDKDANYLKTLEGHHNHVHLMRELADGRILTMGDNSLRIWDLDAEPIISETPHIFLTRRIVVLGDNQIASWGIGETRCLWDETGQPIKTLTGYTQWIEQTQFLDEQRTLSWQGRYLSYQHAKIPNLPLGVDKHRHYIDRRVSENQVLRWRPFHSLGIQNNDGEIISLLDGELYLGNRERIFAWLREHDINPDSAYPEIEFPKLRNCRVSYDMTTNLIIYDSQTGQTIHTFYGEALFTSIAVIDDVVIAGDHLGRVIFLRWIE